MPPPANPPPSDEAGALLSPRQLNRWLDINPVSKLTRTRGYFTIPAFNVAVDWKGYSELVAAFNITATNNFSLSLLLSALPVNETFLLCVMWEDEDLVTHRYAIWNDVGEVIYFDLPLYTNQQIKRNFRLEVWSVADQANAVQAAAFTFYTSILGVYDYMHQADFAVGTASAIITDFMNVDNPGVNFDVPLVFPNNSVPQLN